MTVDERVVADGNIFEGIPSTLGAEVFEDLVRSSCVRIERILSQGQTSPETGLYDQDENEWVIVVEGRGRLQFDGGETVELGPGDYIEIPAHTRHRVVWTDPDAVTIWLAVFF